VLFETRMERCFSCGAEKHLTTGDDYRQRQQEQPEEPQRKLREHRHRYMTINEVCRFGPRESSSAGVWNAPAGFWPRLLDGLRGGWASILPFEGWTEADTKRLEKFLQNVVGDEAEP